MSEAKERREDRGLTWRVALLGAVAALLGTVAGSGATVWVDERDARRTDDARVRDLKTSVYKKALGYENRILDQPAIDTSNLAKAIARSPDLTGIKFPVGPEHLKAWILQVLAEEPQRQAIFEDLQLYGSSSATAEWTRFTGLLLDLAGAQEKAFLAHKDAAPDEGAYYVKLRESNTVFGTLVRSELVGRFD